MIVNDFVFYVEFSGVVMPLRVPGRALAERFCPFFFLFNLHFLSK